MGVRRSNRFFLVIITNFILIQCSSGSGNPFEASQEDNCDECSLKVNTTMGMMKETFRSRDPIPLESPDPCNDCVFGGISTIEPNGEVCSIKVMEGDDTCYDHRLKLKFTKVVMNCTCIFPTNVGDMAKMMSENSKKPYGGDQCMESGNVHKVPMKMAGEGVQVVQVDPQTIMSLKECQPAPPSTDPFKKPPPKTAKGGVVMTYTNFLMEVVLRSCDENKEVRTMDVTLGDVDPKDVTIKCVYDENNKFFLEPCLCFCKLDYMDKLGTASMKGMFPCYGDKKVNENKDLMHQFVCND